MLFRNRTEPLLKSRVALRLVSNIANLQVIGIELLIGIVGLTATLVVGISGRNIGAALTFLDRIERLPLAVLTHHSHRLKAVQIHHRGSFGTLLINLVALHDSVVAIAGVDTEGVVTLAAAEVQIGVGVVGVTVDSDGVVAGSAVDGNTIVIRSVEIDFCPVVTTSQVHVGLIASTCTGVDATIVVALSVSDGVIAVTGVELETVVGTVIFEVPFHVTAGSVHLIVVAVDHHVLIGLTLIFVASVDVSLAVVSVHYYILLSGISPPVLGNGAFTSHRGILLRTSVLSHTAVITGLGVLRFTASLHNLGIVAGLGVLATLALLNNLGIIAGIGILVVTTGLAHFTVVACASFLITGAGLVHLAAVSRANPLVAATLLNHSAVVACLSYLLDIRVITLSDLSGLAAVSGLGSLYTLLVRVAGMDVLGRVDIVAVALDVLSSALPLGVLNLEVLRTFPSLQLLRVTPLGHLAITAAFSGLQILIAVRDLKIITLLSSLMALALARL